MSGRQLSYSRASLLSRAVMLLLFSSMGFALAFGWGRDDDAMCHHIGLCWLMGAENMRRFFEATGILSLLVSLAVIRRLFGSGVAAAIRDKGIEFNGVFFSRFVAWQDLNGIRRYRRHGLRGSRTDMVRAETASGAREIAIPLLRADDTEIGYWIKAANEARARGFSSQVGRGFGRK
jgi:hypothetical protein